MIGKEYRPLAGLVLLVVALLAPFLNKPFHIDDVYWLKTAQQIEKNPFDPFGYRINWAGHEQSAAQIVQAPPLFSYLLAGWGEAFGFSEISCHGFNLCVAVLATIGIYILAIRLGCDPFVTTLISVVSPVFLLSASIVMSDLLMLMFLIWSLAVFLRAQARGSIASYICAMLLACGCVLTKYNGLMVVGLLFLSNVFYFRKLNAKLLWLLIPIVALPLYLQIISRLYGQNFLGSTVSYIQMSRSGASSHSAPIVTGLVFASAVVFAGFPFAWGGLKWKQWLALIAVVIVLESFVWQKAAPVLWTLQHAFWLLGSLVLIGRVVRGAYERRDSLSWLLMAWLGATFVFAAFVNWSVNGRSLITLVPAIGLLVARAFPELGTWPRRKVFIFAVPSLICALLVVRADFEMAWATRRAAERITSDYRHVWFDGHWGFPFYMLKSDAQQLDLDHTVLVTGGVLVLAANNSVPASSLSNAVTLISQLSLPHRLAVAVMSRAAGAGYYTAEWGGLPFVFGIRPIEQFYIFKIEARR